MPDDKYFEPEIETMPRADIEAYQQERILELLPYAYERSGLIRETWEAAGVKPADIRSLDDFRERVPFISKDAIRRYRDTHGDPYGGLLCIDAADLSGVFSSSGTTGDATFFLEQFDEWAPLPTNWARGLWGAGVRPGDYTIATGGTYRGPFYQMGQLCGAVPIMVDTMAGDWREIFPLIERYRPTWVHLVAPNLVTLDQLSRTYDIAGIFSSFKGIGFGGEPLGARMRRVTREWGFNLFKVTSAGDLGGSFECAEHDGHHLWEDTGIFEHLDPVGTAAVPDGELGELVSTSLDDWAAPLIRYRTDDLVRLTRVPCACGRTHARQWPIGRKGDEIVVAGRSVLPVDVWAAIEEVPETASGVFQLIRPQRELEELRVRIGYDTTITGNLEDLTDRLGAAILAAVGVEPRIELRPQDELLVQARAHKLPRVVKE